MSLNSFFKPRSVAVIGASREKGKIGRIIFDLMRTRGFDGEVYPVNPKAKTIAGIKSSISVKNIKDRIDLAIIAVPANVVPTVLKDCIDKKIPSIVIITGGFSETGEKGEKLENQLKEIVRGTETRIIGPNCLGIYDAYSKVDCLFLPPNKVGRPKKGHISFITQSGAVGGVSMDFMSLIDIGISKFVSYGNAIDVDECDLIEYLGKDETTEVICVYLEGIKGNGKKFVKISRKVSRKKPIVILKAGKGKRGEKAVSSHTGSMAGSSKIYSAAFKQCGIIEAENYEELFDFAKAFVMQPLPKGDKIVIITDGGGFGVLATDEAERQGLSMPEPDEHIKRTLKKVFPAHGILHNPIDLTGDATNEMYRIAIEECLKSKIFDGVIVLALYTPHIKENLSEYIIHANNKNRDKKPLLVATMGGKFSDEISRELDKSGIPTFPTAERVVKAFAAMVKYSKWLKTH